MPRPTPDSSSVPVASHRAAFRVPLAAPTDFELCVRRYAAFGPDAANRLDPDGSLRFARAIPEVPREARADRSSRDQRYVVRVAGAGGRERPAARVEVWGTTPPDAAARRAIRDEVRWRFCAHLDLRPFYGAAAKERVLGPLAERFRGYRPPLSPTPFEALVTSISAQQVNLAFAFATRGRLVRAYGPRVRTPEGETFHAFPGAEHLAGARSRRLRRFQFSGVKTRAILELAREIRLGRLPVDEMADWDGARIHEALVRLHGIGRWTADWFLARALGRAEAWPAGDLGVRKAVAHYYFGGKDQPEEGVRKFGARFAPHQNLAAHYLLMGYVADRRVGSSAPRGKARPARA